MQKIAVNLPETMADLNDCSIYGKATRISQFYRSTCEINLPGLGRYAIFRPRSDTKWYDSVQEVEVCSWSILKHYVSSEVLVTAANGMGTVFGESCHKGDSDDNLRPVNGVMSSVS